MGSKRLCHLSPQPPPNVFLFVCFCYLFIYFEAGSYCAALAGPRLLVPLTQPLITVVNTAHPGFSKLYFTDEGAGMEK